MNDPISDMLIRIKNAGMAGHATVSVPFSKIKSNILRILKNENFIDGFEKKGKKVKKTIVVKLRQTKEGDTYISDVKRISKPGRRIYKQSDKLFPIKQGYGIAILSTSKGIMTGKEAKKQKLGGEVICEIW